MSKPDKTFDPNLNPHVIALVEQEDGNWKGYAQKHGKLVEVRDYGPEVVLMKLITYGG